MRMFRQGSHKVDIILFHQVKTRLLIVRQLIIRIYAVSVDIVRVDCVAAEIACQGDAFFDQVLGRGVFNVDPALVGKFGPEVAEQGAVGGSVPGCVVVAVGGLDEAGVEVADYEYGGVLGLEGR